MEALSQTLSVVGGGVAHPRRGHAAPNLRLLALAARAAVHRDVQVAVVRRPDLVASVAAVASAAAAPVPTRLAALHLLRNLCGVLALGILVACSHESGGGVA